MTKNILLEGKGLALANDILRAHKHHRAVHDAWVEKNNHEHQQLQDNSNIEISALLVLLGKELGLEPNPAQYKPSLDMRYLEEHGIAFMCLDVGDEDEPLLEQAAMDQ